MHLILSQPTTDINIKMSTQTESPINRDNNETNQYQIDQETIAAIEKTLNNETETDLPALKITKDFVLEGESIDTKTNGNKCISEETIKEDKLIENINSNVLNNIPNGISLGCSQDSYESESKTRNLDNTNADEPATNKTVDLQPCLPNNSSKHLECLTEPEKKSDLANTDEPLCENSKTLLEDTSPVPASVNINVPVNGRESDPMKDNGFTVDEKIDKPTEVIKDACGSDTEKPNNETQNVELITADTKYLDDVIMDDDENKASQESGDVVTNNESNILINKEVNVLTNNEPNILSNKEVKDLALIVDEDVAMHEVVDEDVAMHEINGIGVDEIPILPKTEDLNPIEIDAKVLSPVQTSIDIISPEPRSLEPVKLGEEAFLPLQTSENVKSIVAEDLKLVNIEIDEKVSPLLQTCENKILPEESTLKPIEIAEVKLSSNLNSDQCVAKNKSEEETDDVTMAEIEETSNNVTSENTNQLKDDASEIHFNNIKKNDGSLTNSTIICDENKVIGHEKNKHNDSMEIDYVEIINVEKENQEDIPKNISDTTSNEEVCKDTIIEETSEIEIISDIPAKEKVNEYNIAVRKDLKSNKIENKTESEESSKIILEKGHTENIITVENLANSEAPVTTAEKNNDCKDTIEKEVKSLTTEDQENIEIIDEDDVKFIDLGEEKTNTQTKENPSERQEINTLPVVCKLSNTLDILSDDEEEASNIARSIQPQTSPEDKQCINLDDDDDIMLIEEEEDSNSKDKPDVLSNKEETEPKLSDKVDEETGEKHSTDITDLMPQVIEKDNSPENISKMELDSVPETENKLAEEDKSVEKKTPLLPPNFLKTAKKNLADMSRHELEDFCILRIVESIVDRSNLSEIKTKMKTMAQNLDDLKKRATMMTKQNRDLQVVMKSVQEEQKNQTNVPIHPLKITRSVGMQVLMNDKLDHRRKAPIPTPGQPAVGPTGRPLRAVQSAKQIKPPPTPPTIPVPRKVPVNNSPAKALTNTPASSAGNKSVSPHPNGLRYSPPVQKVPEKRTHSRMQTTSVTVDLTDDEPPTKVSNKSSPSQPVRVVPPQNLLAQQRQFPPLNNNARKVYIPISGAQARQIRSEQAIVMKNMVNPGPRLGPRPPMPRAQQSPVRPKQNPTRHPAPLPESMKQYTPPTWKALPPAPDLKLSKVENGIVISWKIDGYPEGGYETIASYQLYAYQETNVPPCTALWKKIGDVKALPLPMACTLTQFMAGFKYYFAVRAVDVRSRLGPFSLPGSILLLNKV